MIPVDQTTFGDGSDGSEPGNCFAACIATILGMPLSTVPNFCAAGDTAWWTAVQAWLRPRGLYAMDMTWGPEEAREVPPGVWSTGYVAPGAIVILSGPAERGFQHSVVIRATEDGPRLLHDPHPSRAGLIRGTHITVLIPLDPGRGSIPQDRCRVDDVVVTFEEAHRILDAGATDVECEHAICPRDCPNWTDPREGLDLDLCTCDETPGDAVAADPMAHEPACYYRAAVLAADSQAARTELDAAVRRARAIAAEPEPKCPAAGCGVGVLRPKCLFELSPVDCPRHDLAAAYRRRQKEIARGAEPRSLADLLS